MPMPEISEQDFQQLKDQVAALSSQLTAARNRIDDLENFATDHLGLDWGESLVDANSPHPNMSVNTIESGGGVIRQDAHGMQIRAPLGDANAITFVSEFVNTDPTDEVPSATLFGNVDSALDFADIHFGARVSNGNVGSYATATGGYVASGLNPQWGAYLPEVRVLANSSGGYVFLSGQICFLSDVSPAQITADQNDYSPTGLSAASVLRLNSDAARNITGLAGGSDGRVVIIFNVGSFNIVLKDESASSSASNRFALKADITISTDGSALLVYDETTLRWRCAGTY